MRYNYKLKNKPLGLAIFLVLLIIFLVGPYLPEKYSKYLKFRTRFGATTHNVSNRWYYKFDYLDGKIKGHFTAKYDDAILIRSSNLEKGIIEFQLYDSSNNLISTFSATNNTDTLRGVFEKGRKYKIRGIASKAKGHFDFKME